MKNEFKRMRYFNGLSLRAEDYNLDKELHTRLQRLHNRYLHTWGIAHGLEVKSVIESSMEVYVTEGFALDLVNTLNTKTGISESLSRQILIYDGHPDNPIDLSEYSVGDNIYIMVSYKEIPADRNKEKGQGKEIHVWERAALSHSKIKPLDCKENIILARVVPRRPTAEEYALSQDNDAIIDSTCIFDTDVDGSTLRVYVGPYAKIMELEKFIFMLGEDSENMPFLFSLLNDDKKICLKVNSPSTTFTGSTNIKGDIVLGKDLIWKSPGKVNNEFNIKECVLQVNSPRKGKWKPRDAGLEVYRGGPNVAPDARVVWSEAEKTWKIGIGNDLYKIGGDSSWEKMINKEICDNLHQHGALYSTKGKGIYFEDNGNLSVNGELAINDHEINWGEDHITGGIGWSEKKGMNVDGPVLYGFGGGMLGVTAGGQKSVLSWNSSGNVGIGSTYPLKDMLDVQGSICLLEGSNPVKFTAGWNGFSDSTINKAEISNDSQNYRSLMIVGNQSAGQGRKVAVWDRLDVNGLLYVNGNMKINNVLTPSSGKSNNGIIFPPDPGGGWGDSAWLKYYPLYGEACTFEIGTSNDGDDNISLMPSGGVGIGTLSPTDKLSTTGWTRLMSGTNPIRFSSSWSGFPDVATNQAEISNDIGNYKTLMFVGNKSGAQGRKVSVWDTLDVKGSLVVNGSFEVSGAIVPGVGEEESRGIWFPKDPCGGYGDVAWIRYFSDRQRGGGENMTLEIGIANDSNVELVRQAYWKSYCSWCSSPSNNRYGCGHWEYVDRWIQGNGGDRIRLFASGGVYIEGGFYYSSSREYKDNIKKLCTDTLENALEELEPVEFNFKGDHRKRTMGFIAEDVGDMFTAHDKKAINPMELITVLVSETKEQENILNGLKKKVANLKNKRI